MVIKLFFKKNLFLAVVALLFLTIGTTFAQDNTSRAFKKGYQADIQLEANTFKQSLFSTSHGCNVGRGFYVGGGSAFGAEFQPDFSSKAKYLSLLFVEMRHTLMNKEAAPFVSARMGAILRIADNTTARTFINPNVGFVWGRFLFKAGFMFQVEGENCAIFAIGFCF